MPTVRPEFGPTLPDALAPPLRMGSRRVRGLLLGGALLVAAVLVLVSALRTGPALEPVLVGGAVPFTLVHTDTLERVAPTDGDALRLQTAAGAETQMSFAVRTFRLGAYAGDPIAQLALRASRDTRRLAATLPGFVYRGDGKARINESPGQVLSFQTRRDGGVVYGKRYYLVPGVEPGDPAPQVGAEVTMLASRGDQFPNVAAVGNNGALKQPLRSFRFGTERP